MFSKKRVRIGAIILAVLLLCGLIFAVILQPAPSVPVGPYTESKGKKYIKWVDFNVPYTALATALDYDLKSYDTATHADWVDLLALTAAKTGGNFGKSGLAELSRTINKIKEGKTIAELSENQKYFSYYRESYGAVLDGFVGEYAMEADDGNGGKKEVTKYGLKVFSPIARGYGFGHYDDFGNARDYGYRRRHLGNDLLCGVGTPVVAVEGGVIEALGWNQYGGWRIGIRSGDGKRYYYYAHLRRNHPYVKTLKEGDIVKSGDVIGYVGMTGYSRKENVNNIKVPHLHFGLQLIFDESQKDGNGEIWVDVYHLVELLQKNRMAIDKNDATGDAQRRYDFIWQKDEIYPPLPQNSARSKDPSDSFGTTNNSPS